MAKNKGIYRLFRTKAEYERHNEDIRHFTRVFMLDHVTIALGRMGFRESKFAEFDEEDLKDDKEMVYSRALLDRELKQYTGKLFAPAEERYR